MLMLDFTCKLINEAASLYIVYFVASSQWIWFLSWKQASHSHNHYTFALANYESTGSISTIIVCRFLLNLRKFNTSPQNVPSLNIATISGLAPGIHGRLQYLNKSIIDDFGGIALNYESESDDNMDDQQTFPGHIGGIDTKLRITAEEFPWAITSTQDVAGLSKNGEMWILC